MTANLIAMLAAVLLHVPGGAARPAHRGFELFAVPQIVTLQANRVQCSIDDVGDLCMNRFNSCCEGGGFWPRGTNDQYIYQGGINFAARILGSPQANFPWPGDTVGGWFMDLRGDQRHGEALTRIADGRILADLLHWPTAGRAMDPAVFAPALLGRATVSDQDSWVRYWDGNPALSNGRKHPAGILVDQRSMSFNTPGLEDVVFFVFRLVNVTSRNPADYQGLAAAGYSPQDIADIAAIGATFQDRMERTYNILIPDAGYVLDSMYVAFNQDPDIGSAGANESNMNLVFSTSLAWKPDFRENTWQYPLDVFAPPFAQAPGIAASAFLRTPPSLVPGAPRVWMSGNFTSGAPFPDRVGVASLWRNNSGNVLPTDGTCSFPSPKSRHFCQLVQVPHDTRFFMSTGPGKLGPGESAVVILAQVFAPAVESAVLPFIGSVPGMTGGFPVDGTRLLNGLDTLRVLDRAAGWVSHADVNGNGVIEASEVLTTPRSVFARIQAAQRALDRGFLMPAAPEAPAFYPVPGDQHVTIAWQPSTSETAGDPYFTVAADPTTPLYDPDFRRFDVEGYRVWRGTSPENMQVIAQFDHTGTAFQDVTGQVVSFGGSTCAPELGATTGCPTFPQAYGLVYGPFSVPLVQTRIGDRVRLQNGAIGILRADTAVIGGASGRAPLEDSGVPFLFVDSTARNGRTYLYAVTAFDVNSVRSGRSTLESPLMVRAATPRAPAGNAQLAVITTGMFGGDGETELDPSAPFPALDSVTGTFKGIFPPADGTSLSLLVSLADALSPGDYTGKIDSVTAGGPVSLTAVTPTVYMTFSGPGVTQAITLPMQTFHSDPPSRTTDYYLSLPLIPFDTGQSRRLGIPGDFAASARMTVTLQASFEPISAGPAATMLCGRGLLGIANCGGGPVIQASRYLLHSRWYDEGAAEPPDPTLDFNPSADHNSGKLTGVAAIWNPMPYRVPIGAGGATRMSQLSRFIAYGITGFYPADFVVTWGTAGQITVRDSTHRTDLPYTTGMGAGYGFISGAAIAAAGVTTSTLQFSTFTTPELGAPRPSVPSYHSLYTVRPVCDALLTAALAGAIPCVNLSKTAVLQGLDLSNPADGNADANGIVLMINGEAFFMAVPAVPAFGTRWHLKAIGGLGLTATCTPSLGATVIEIVTPPTDCSSYHTLQFNSVRPALAPGLQFKIRVTQGFTVGEVPADLKAVHTVPDPYYFTNSLETAAGSQVLRFVNLPDRANIRIYSAGGALTAVLSHNDPSGGGEEAWDLRSRSGRAVASGVYFYHVEAADGQTRVGRFVVVNGTR